jgi:hypothetical protein
MEMVLTVLRSPLQDVFGAGVRAGRSIDRHEDVSMKRPALGIDELLPGAFEPCTILPAQFFTGRQRNRARTGEQCLMAAILEDAIAVYLRPKPPRTSKAFHLLWETRRWVHSNDRSWVFSFLRICEALDLDPNAIRRGLRIRRGQEPVEPRCSSSGGPMSRSLPEAVVEPGPDEAGSQCTGAGHRSRSGPLLGARGGEPLPAAEPQCAAVVQSPRDLDRRHRAPAFEPVDQRFHRRGLPGVEAVDRRIVC